jgi:hypothetical protein
MLSMVNRNSTNRGADTQASMPQAFDVTALIEASRPALATAAEMNGRLYETVAALNSEYVSFINRRLKEDLGVPQQFAACRNVEDVYGVYTGFFQRAAEQYRAEMEHFARLGQGLSQDALHTMADPASASSDRRTMR